MAITTRDDILHTVLCRRKNSTWKGLTLADVLGRYGIPSNALLRTFHDRGPLGCLCVLALIYEDSKFIALYELEGERIGDNVVGCPSSAPPR